jgi:hypothetical protein
MLLPVASSPGMAEKDAAVAAEMQNGLTTIAIANRSFMAHSLKDHLEGRSVDGNLVEPCLGR